MNGPGAATSASETVVGVSGALVGLGALTVALFPFTIPGLALLVFFTAPFLVVGIVVGIAAAIATAAWLAARALIRRANAALTPPAPAATVSRRGR
jgi:hypothetical protein